MSLIQAEVDVSNASLGKIGAKQFTLAVQTSIEGVQANLHFAQTRDSLLRSFEWSFAKTRIAIVSDWLTDTVYTTDQYVWQSSLLYKCIIAHTSGTFATDLTAAKWTLVSTISAWVTLTVYAVGDLVTTNALLYKCATAHTAGVFATDLAAVKWTLESTKPVNDFGYNYDLPADYIRVVRVFDSYDDEDLEYTLESNDIFTDETVIDLLYVKQETTVGNWDYLFKELFICQLALNLLNPLTGMGSGAIAVRTLLLQELIRLTKLARTVARQESNTSGKSDWNDSRYL